MFEMKVTYAKEYIQQKIISERFLKFPMFPRYFCTKILDAILTSSTTFVGQNSPQYAIF